MAPARRLAVLRILIGVYAVVYLLARFPAMLSVTRLPPAQFEPAGPVHLLSAPLPAPVVIGLAIVAIALGVAFLIGWRFRITGPAFAAALIWVLSYRTSWGMTFHTENLLVLHVWALGFSPAADVLSRDADAGPPPEDSERYGWAIWLMCAITLLTYVLAGYAKLQREGLDWLFSDTLQVIVANDNLRKVELGDPHAFLGGFLVRHDWVFPPLAILSVALELGAPVALLGRRVAHVWAALAWSFHLGVVLLMFILFPYQLFGFAYAPFFDVEKLTDRVQRWWRRRRS